MSGVPGRKTTHLAIHILDHLYGYFLDHLDRNVHNFWHLNSHLFDHLLRARTTHAQHSVSFCSQTMTVTADVTLITGTSLTTTEPPSCGWVVVIAFGTRKILGGWTLGWSGDRWHPRSRVLGNSYKYWHSKILQAPVINCLSCPDFSKL